MLFSIIIPTINRSRSILHALSSVFTQTYPTWEVIIVDADKEISQLILPLLPHDRRVRYIQKSYHTESEARALGISAARGDVITFLDADDYIAPTHLETHYDYFATNPSVETIIGKPTIIGSPYIQDTHSPDHYSHVHSLPTHGTFFIKEYVFDHLGAFPSDTHALYEAIKSHKFVSRHIAMPTYIYDRSDR